MSDYNANAIRAKILRRKILELIAENYVLSAAMISHTLLLSYATVLRHLRILKEEGYIELYKEGRTLYAKIRENAKEIQNLNSELRGLIKSQVGGNLTQNVKPGLEPLGSRDSSQDS